MRTMDKETPKLTNSLGNVPLELDVYIMWDKEISGQSMQLNLIILYAERIEEVHMTNVTYKIRWNSQLRMYHGKGDTVQVKICHIPKQCFNNRGNYTSDR